MGEKFDHGFGIMVGWDIPLLDGYPYEFLQNTAKVPGVHHFRGIQNPDLVKQIISYKPDAILVVGWSFASHLKALVRFKNKIPVYFRGDSTFLDSPGNWKKRIRILFLRWIYSHVHTAFYVGKNNYKYYLNAGMKPKQLVFAPHAIDNHRFMQPDEEYNSKAKEFRKSMHIAEGDFVFLFAGKFEANKNPFLLMNAFLELQKAENVHLVLTGNGPMAAGLLELANHHSNIHFSDFQNQLMMPVVYRAADVFVLPSRNETWGLAINEAMACSCPVIVSDKCGGAIDLVDPSVNGYIFKAGDKEDLKEKMQLMLQQKDQLQKMKSASLSKIQQFSFTHICEAIEKQMTN